MTTTEHDIAIPEGSIPIDEALNRIQMEDYTDEQIYFVEICEGGGNHLRVQVPWDGKSLSEICNELWSQCLNFELGKYHITSIKRLEWHLDTPKNDIWISYHMSLSRDEIVKGE